MKFKCLLAKSYKGTSLARQKQIVAELGGVQLADTFICYITADSLERVKEVESALKGKVPYIKEV